MVATKSLKAGDVILKEFPLTVAPGSLSQRVCFACHKHFSKGYMCRQCRSPICNNTCKMSLEHQKECGLLQRIAESIESTKSAKSAKSVAASAEVPVNVAVFAMPLRCLLMRLEQPDKWNNFIQMEAHMQVRRQMPTWSFVERRIAPHLLAVLKDLMPDVDTELIQRVCGILDVNSFEIRTETDALRQPESDIPTPLLTSQEVLRGSYYQAALMAHSCLANAQISIGVDHMMVIRAQVDTFLL